MPPYGDSAAPVDCNRTTAAASKMGDNDGGPDVAARATTTTSSSTSAPKKKHVDRTRSAPLGDAASALGVSSNREHRTLPHRSHTGDGLQRMPSSRLRGGTRNNPSSSSSTAGDSSSSTRPKFPKNTARTKSPVRRSKIPDTKEPQTPSSSSSSRKLNKSTGQLTPASSALKTQGVMDDWSLSPPATPGKNKVGGTDPETEPSTTTTSSKKKSDVIQKKLEEKSNTTATTVTSSSSVQKSTMSRSRSGPISKTINSGTSSNGDEDASVVSSVQQHHTVSKPQSLQQRTRNGSHGGDHEKIKATASLSEENKIGERDKRLLKRRESKRGLQKSKSLSSSAAREIMSSNNNSSRGSLLPQRPTSVRRTKSTSANPATISTTAAATITAATATATATTTTDEEKEQKEEGPTRAAKTMVRRSSRRSLRHARSSSQSPPRNDNDDDNTVSATSTHNSRSRSRSISRARSQSRTPHDSNRRSSSTAPKRGSADKEHGNEHPQDGADKNSASRSRDTNRSNSTVPEDGGGGGDQIRPKMERRNSRRQSFSHRRTRSRTPKITTTATFTTVVTAEPTETDKKVDDSAAQISALRAAVKQVNEETSQRRKTSVSPPRSNHSRGASFSRSSPHSVSPAERRGRSPPTKNGRSSPSASRPNSTSPSSLHRRSPSARQRSKSRSSRQRRTSPNSRAVETGEGSETPAPKQATTVAPPSNARRRNSLTIANVFDLVEDTKNNDYALDAHSVGDSSTSQSDVGEDTVVQFDPTHAGSVSSFKRAANDESLNNSGVFKMESLRESTTPTSKKTYLPGAMNIKSSRSQAGEGRIRQRPGRRTSARSRSPNASSHHHYHDQKQRDSAASRRQSLTLDSVFGLNSSQSKLDNSQGPNGSQASLCNESLGNSSCFESEDGDSASDLSSRNRRRQRVRDRRRPREQRRTSRRARDSQNMESSKNLEDEETEDDEAKPGYLPQNMTGGKKSSSSRSKTKRSDRQGSQSLDGSSEQLSKDGDDDNDGDVDNDSSSDLTSNDEAEAASEGDSLSKGKHRRSSTMSYLKKQLRRSTSRSSSQEPSATSSASTNNDISGDPANQKGDTKKESLSVKKKLKSLLKKKDKEKKHASLLQGDESDSGISKE